MCILVVEHSNYMHVTSYSTATTRMLPRIPQQLHACYLVSHGNYTYVTSYSTATTRMLPPIPQQWPSGALQRVQPAALEVGASRCDSQLGWHSRYRVAAAGRHPASTRPDGEGRRVLHIQREEAAGHYRRCSRGNVARGAHTEESKLVPSRIGSLKKQAAFFLHVCSFFRSFFRVNI